MARQQNPGRPVDRDGEVSVLEEIRHRKKLRRLRRTVVLVLVLTILLAWVTGLASASLTAAADLIDTVRIAQQKGEGYPLQTGITELYQLEPVTGGYVALGGESCVVYSAGGARLRNIQTGYARPAIAAGSTRFLIYNRGSTELRVESRTKTLYTQTMPGSILQCAIAKNGTFAAVTESSGYAAQLTIYSSAARQILTWSTTETEGIPLRLAFSDSGSRLAVATLRTQGGQIVSGLYVLDTGKKSQTALAACDDSLPLEVVWLPGSRLLVLYDDQAVVYDAGDGTVEARFSYEGRTLTDWSVRGSGSIALLLDNGVTTELYLLDGKLETRAQTQVTGGRGTLVTRTAMYVWTDAAVECYSLQGEYQWKQDCTAKPQQLLEAGSLLVFYNDAVAECAPTSEA